MFKKIMNSLMAVTFTVFAASTTIDWGDIFSSGNSLFFFGEPQYPFDK